MPTVLESCVVMLEGQEGGTYDDILRIARHSEELGFGAVFRSDHWLPIMGARSLDATDAWTTLAGLARDTTRIRFGTLVSPMTFRHPSQLAKIAATIDQMSGGRVEIGFGTGWYEAEHAAYGLPFPPLGERFDILEEALQICTSLWSEGSTTFEGKHFSLKDAPGLPKPVQRPLPVIVGGRGPKRTADLTACFAHEYNTGGDLDEWTRRCGNVRAACERNGRDPESVVYSWFGPTIVGHDEADALRRAKQRMEHSGATGDVRAWLDDLATRNLMFGSASQVAEQVAALRERGASRWHFQVVPHPDDDMLELLAKEVAAKAG